MAHCDLAVESVFMYVYVSFMSLSFTQLHRFIRLHYIPTTANLSNKDVHVS